MLRFKKLSIYVISAFLCCVCLALTVDAQIFLDPTFGTKGIVITDSLGPYGPSGFNSITTTSDGKLIAAGRAFGSFLMYKYDNDGKVDNSFGTNGRVIHSFRNSIGSSAACVVEQPDGKLLVAGSAYIGDDDIAIARFHANGTLDTSFSDSGEVVIDLGADEGCTDFALQQDGKMVICGAMSPYGIIVRLDTNGHLDTSFNKTGIFTVKIDSNINFFNSIRIKQDGKILACGNIWYNNCLVQLLHDGTLDSNFGNNGIMATGKYGYGNDIDTQSDGKIIMVSTDFTASGYVVRYMPDGKVDSSFASNGIVEIKHSIGPVILEAVAIDKMGNIYTSGKVGLGTTTPVEDIFIVRIDSIGRLDTTFGGPNGIATSVTPYSECVYDMCVQADGKIVMAGSIHISPDSLTPVSAKGVLMRYLPSPVNVHSGPNYWKPLKVYPNPATDVLYIENGHNAVTGKFYVITNTLGQSFQQGVITAKEIDISNIPDGVYMLQVFDKNSASKASARFTKF